ncbi:MAG: PEP/pyruvate-binding domain-containing protein [Candidatus Cryptobacteroides sp.]|nr:PEP/pyruvate-binding domain-containing protein [Candidatus Cryptobacteroides sp.]
MNEESLMRSRIRKILMICSNYDAFALEEDGRIENQVRSEYRELNLSNPPKFIWANSSQQAREIVSSETEVDMIICMFNEQDKGIFPFASELKEEGRGIPFVLLIHYSKAVRQRVLESPRPGVDFVFSWHGNADLILAIVKLLEDAANADNDVFEVGVKGILLVEDSIRYYSNYLPELYKIVLTQSREFLKESLNEDQKKYRKRSRPKIFLATCLEEALAYFRKYGRNLLGVISDVGMVVHKGDDPKTEKLDAGIDLVKVIREYDPLMPVLLQSSQGGLAKVAEELGVGFLKKYSSTLFLQLGDYMREEFGFGDFVFRDAGGVECGRAASLSQLERIINDIPDKVLVSNTSRNMFSKWLYARGLFNLAETFRAEHHTDASEFRSFLLDNIRRYHRSIGQGIITEFHKDSYEDYFWFSRVGDGSLGGKARGLAFLNHLIQKYSLTDKYEGLRISIPRTIVLTTDWFDKFILGNGLQYVIDSDLSDDEILSEFVASTLPEELAQNLKAFLATVDGPLAVRSSSKLEDSNYQPFAGVYATYMCPPVENKDRMLRELGKAVKSVYASTYFRGSRNYIQASGNLLGEEKMAVIVQTICGTAHGNDFYPMMSGVGRSLNSYPIGAEKASDGVLNVAFGLGRTVVDGGRSLRVDPLHPKKILQLSNPRLSQRDTQNEMFVLDMSPAAFKISRNDGVNLRRIPVAEALDSYDHPELVASTYDALDDRMVPGIGIRGARVISFDGIFQYDRLPLAKALSEVMSICRNELMSEVEIEFALDPDPSSAGREADLKLLQVRPVSSGTGSQTSSIEDAESSIANKLIRSDSALGNGYFTESSRIVVIMPESFDKMKTALMAEEVSAINSGMIADGLTYFLVGPGRWGSSIPTLGVPVAWTDISAARMVVEYGIDGFRIDPSQGTHFFQNITSLGVGYLSVDQYAGSGMIDFEALGRLECVHDGQFVKVFKVDGLTGFIDRNKGKALVGF